MPMPAQKPGRSKQDYGTPPEFITATCGLLGIKSFIFDYAADDQNHKASKYWTEKHNALSYKAQAWAFASFGGWGWLNPPFKRIVVWAKKCAEARQLGASIAFLVPAGVGSNWFRDWVHGKAFVWFLNGRIDFIPGEPYPKDCILCLYSPDWEPGYDVWSLRT